MEILSVVHHLCDWIFSDKFMYLLFIIHSRATDRDNTVDINGYEIELGRLFDAFECITMSLKSGWVSKMMKVYIGLYC